MKKHQFMVFTTLLILSCQNVLEVDTTKHTATDPIADITYLNGYFYTTNLDNAANAGPQIDLYKFNDSLLPVDRYPLDLNGQGYMAVTNDKTNLYFQPRFTDYILKMTPLGEIFWYESDYFPDNMADTTSTFMYWRGRGLAWADTNLVALYRHKDDSTLYRWRFLNINGDSFQTIDDTTVVWDHLNDSGAFALEYDAVEDAFLVLATDSSNNYILFQVKASLEFENKIYAIEEEVMGVTLTAEPKIYLAYPDRRIEEFTRPAE